MTWLTNPYRFGAPPGTGPHRYWGVTFLSTVGEQYAGLAEIEMAATVGGSDQCSGGTASASSVNPGADVAAKLFDDNNTTAWAGTKGALDWVMYDFGVPVDVAEVRMRARSTLPAQAPRAFSIWGSDDAGATRYAYHIETGLSAWTASESRSFAISLTRLPTDFGNARVWMVDITANNGDGVLVVQEMEFANTTGGATICSGGAPGATLSFSTTFHPGRLTDGASTEWAGENMNPAAKILYTFPAVANPVQLRLKARASGATSAPKDFTIHWSADGLTFTQTNAVTNETGWSVNEVRGFAITHP